MRVTATAPQMPCMETSPAVSTHFWIKQWPHTISGLLVHGLAIRQIS